jgi:hypothetical protein
MLKKCSLGLKTILGVKMMNKKEIEKVVCYNAKPIFIGQELKGYFIDKDNFSKLLTLISDEAGENDVK